MYTHEDLSRLQAQSLKMQSWIRQQTFSPENRKTLRRFSSWEVAELIFRINQSTFRGRFAAEPDLPGGEVEPDGRQRWFTLEEINELRRKMKINRKSLMPPAPQASAPSAPPLPTSRVVPANRPWPCTWRTLPRLTATACWPSISTRKPRSAIRWASTTLPKTTPSGASWRAT